MKNLLFYLLSLYFFLPSLTHANIVNKKVNKNPLSISEVKFKNFLTPGENTELIIRVDLAKGFHAYKEKFKITGPKDSGLIFSPVKLDPMVEWYDKFSKKDRQGAGEGITTLKVNLELPTDIDYKKHDYLIQVHYQACSDEYCLFPKKLIHTLEFEVKDLHATASEPEASQTSNKDDVSSFSLAYFKNAISSDNFFFVLFLAFIAGLLTSLTPCIFPMIPITLAILGTKQEGIKSSQSFMLSLSYVLGIAITYAILGVVAAKTGALFGSYLQHPIVVITIAVIFVIMALSMFGLFTIETPSFINQRMSKVQGKTSYTGAFITGTIAGLVASPCVGPVLVFILTYVAQTQDLTYGFWLLFVYALGLGQIFLLLGAFSHLINKLPKSGSWMNITKNIFGCVMIAMAIYYLMPILKPYLPHSSVKYSEGQIKWTKFNEANLKIAQSKGKIIVVDFYADWCAACIELKEKTFNKAPVTSMHDQIEWMIFDATNSSEQLDIYKEEYGIVGLPHIVIFDQSGKRRDELTLTGFEGPEDFFKRLKATE